MPNALPPSTQTSDKPRASSPETPSAAVYVPPLRAYSQFLVNHINHRGKRQGGGLDGRGTHMLIMKIHMYIEWSEILTHCVHPVFCLL